MLTGAAEREQHEPLGAGVRELAPRGGADADEPIGADDVLDALDAERQLTLEHEEDLLLMLVRVDAPARAGWQHDEVAAERADAELVAQHLTARGGVAVEGGEGERVVGHGFAA